MIYAVKCAGCHSDFPPLKFGEEDNRTTWMQAHSTLYGHRDFGIWTASR